MKKNIGTAIALVVLFLMSTIGVVDGAVNLISNGGFESGVIAPWTFWDPAVLTFSIVSPGNEGNYAAMIKLKSIGSNMQLYQYPVSMEPNTRYRLSFAANSTYGGDITVRLIKHVGGTPYAPDFSPLIETYWQTFSTEFTSSGSAMNDARLMFWFVGRGARAGEAYFIDNVQLEKVSADITPPKVIGNTPKGTNVPVNTPITVTFSEPMNKTSVQSAFDTSPPIAGSFSWSGNTMTYTPSSNLSYNSGYKIVVYGAKDLAGNVLESVYYVWEFSTPDLSPTVIGNTPTGTNVPVNTQITITFSEDMNFTSTKLAFSTSPPIAGSFSGFANTMIYIPSRNLSTGTTYTITEGIGAEDSTGNRLQTPFSWKFTTYSTPDIIPPNVIGSTPTGTNVPITPQITMTFSEAMNMTSAQSAFSISCSPSGTLYWIGNTMYYAPSSNLPYDTTCMVTEGTGAKDLAGNSLQTPYIGQFTTARDIIGSGIVNYLTKWTGNSLIGNSLIYDDGSLIGIGTESPGSKLDVRGSIRGSGSPSGVYGEGPTGVHGAGNTYGVYGEGQTGVNGKGNSFGVNGEGETGVRGAGDVTGVYGRGMIGLYGVSTNTGVGGRNIGVVGEGQTKGVVGSGEGWGGYFDGRTGVWAWGSHYGVDAFGLDTGVYAYGDKYDFYAAVGKYAPFTGSHEVKLSNDFPHAIKPGMIVSVTGDTKLRIHNGTVSLSSTLPTVRLSSTINDKAVFGAFDSEFPLPERHWYNYSEGERFGIVNALGDGRVWVSNINGDIQVGDYITTSSIQGYGQRQDDDLLHSYTLGKSTENVDWSSVTETVESNGQKYKAYLIAVVYTSG